VSKSGEKGFAVFEGSAQLSLDAKGRLAIPARHREPLAVASEGRLVLTANPQGRCLLLYPQPDWLPIRERLLKAPSFDPRSASLKRTMLGNARTEELDSAGRLLIAAELRDYANLGKTVWLVGMGSHFEIWSDEGWKHQHELAAEAFSGEAPPPGFEDFAL